MSQEILAQSPLLRGVAPEDVKRFFDAGAVRTFASGDVVIKEGEPNENLYVVLDGQLEVCLPDSGGRFTKVELGTLETGQCVGEYSFIDKNPASAAVITRGETRLLELSSDDFNRLLARNSAMGSIIYRNLLTVLIDRLRENNAMLDMIRPRR